MTNTHHDVDEIVRAISEQLGRLAARGKLRHENRWGVHVMYNKSEIGLIRFRFVTPDNIEVDFDVDLRLASREYFVSGILKVMQMIDDKRAARRIAELPEFLNAQTMKPISEGTGKVIH